MCILWPGAESGSAWHIHTAGAECRAAAAGRTCGAGLVLLAECRRKGTERPDQTRAGLSATREICPSSAPPAGSSVLLGTLGPASEPENPPRPAAACLDGHLEVEDSQANGEMSADPPDHLPQVVNYSAITGCYCFYIQHLRMSHGQWQCANNGILCRPHTRSVGVLLHQEAYR